MFEWDETKRSSTLVARGLDFADAEIVFAGRCLTIPDERMDYGEARFVTVGELAERVVIVCWTWRTSTIRVISMRKANEREIRAYRQRLDESR